MRLLLPLIHFRLHWFHWLIEQAPNFDLICIAGDLLDMFRSETRMEQARKIRTLVKELADTVPVAVCSGNHDNAGRLVSHDRASVYEWFIDLGAHPNIITDGSTRKLEILSVTTVPYHCSRQEKTIWPTEVPRFADKPECRGSSFITFRPKQGRESAAKKQKPQSILRLIGLTISSRAMNMPFPTRLVKAGTKNWAVALARAGPIAECANSKLHQAGDRIQENSLGTRPAKRGYRRTGFTIIWC